MIRRVLFAVSLVVAAVALFTTQWWGPLALSRLDYFHVRRVEIDGLQYTKTAELMRLIHVDTTQSVWQPLQPIVARIESHAMVLHASVERVLPGTFLVRVTERAPVAFSPDNGTLRIADATGRTLPIDPMATPLDLPIASTPDSTVLQLLNAMRVEAPPLYARVTDARRVGADEVHLLLGDLRVRAAIDVTVARFRDILPVEADLARNHLRAVELDLRFHDQVIARQP